jgi:hypothetical protein
MDTGSDAYNYKKEHTLISSHKPDQVILIIRYSKSYEILFITKPQTTLVHQNRCSLLSSLVSYDLNYLRSEPSI